MISQLPVATRMSKLRTFDSFSKKHFEEIYASLQAIFTQAGSLSSELGNKSEKEFRIEYFSRAFRLIRSPFTTESGTEFTVYELFLIDRDANNDVKATLLKKYVSDYEGIFMDKYALQKSGQIIMADIHSHILSESDVTLASIQRLMS